MSDIEQVSAHMQTLPAEPRAVILDYIGRLQQGKRVAEERVRILEREDVATVLETLAGQAPDYGTRVWLREQAKRRRKQ